MHVLHWDSSSSEKGACTKNTLGCVRLGEEPNGGDQAGTDTACESM